MTHGLDKIRHRDRPRNATDDGEMMDLAEKGFKTVIINMPQHFKERKNIMRREIGRRTIGNC